MQNPRQGGNFTAFISDNQSILITPGHACWSRPSISRYIKHTLSWVIHDCCSIGLADAFNSHDEPTIMRRHSSVYIMERSSFHVCLYRLNGVCHHEALTVLTHVRGASVRRSLDDPVQQRLYSRGSITVALLRLSVKTAIYPVDLLFSVFCYHVATVTLSLLPQTELPKSANVFQHEPFDVL